MKNLQAGLHWKKSLLVFTGLHKSLDDLLSSRKEIEEGAWQIHIFDWFMSNFNYQVNVLERPGKGFLEVFLFFPVENASLTKLMFFTGPYGFH